MFIGVGRGEVIGKVGMIITLFISNPTNVRICMEMILFRMNDRIPMVRSDIHPSVDVIFFFLLFRCETKSSGGDVDDW